MTSSDPPAIGIDLGTTFSVVSVFRKRKSEVIQNDVGERTTPSCVAFGDDDDVYVGKAAKELGPPKCLYDSKRLIGRRYDEPEVQGDIRNWAFDIKNDGGIPKYEVVQDGLPVLMSAEQISAKVLEAMKKTAEDRLEQEVTKAVITVPAYFNDDQRKATIAAGTLADLEVIEILNEPTAAALAFGHEKGKLSTVLIFDLGGGTFDVSVLRLHGDEYKTLAHGGDTHLGGQDFDSILLDYIVEDIKRTERVDPRRYPETLHEIRINCELAKRKLSSLPQTTLSVFLTREGTPRRYDKALTRAFFEQLCMPSFKKAIDYLPQVLKDAKVTKDEIDDVVLVGGSTRIPKVQAMVQEFFNGKKLNKSVNPDEAVAMGAAIRAASLTGQAGARQIVLKEVSSLSLGVATSNGIMAVLIPRNTQLPCKVTKIFTTASDHQEEADIKVCQGERARWEDNHSIGECTLSLPPQPKGEVDIETTFSINEGGCLTVTAKEKVTGEEASVTIESESRLSERELQRLLKEAQVFRENDQDFREEARRERFK